MARKLIAAITVMSALLLFGTTSEATFFDTIVTSGTLNVYQDESREAFVDVDNSGTFSVGDVVIGFTRIDDRISPTGITLGTTTYAIFSQQVTSITGLTGGACTGVGGQCLVSFGATTATGLTLQDFVSGASAGSIIALVTNSSGFTNLITTSSGNVVAPATISMQDYLAHLASGTLEFTAGITQTGDFFHATYFDSDGTLTIAEILALSSSVTGGNFGAGLSIIDNNTSFTFADLVAAAFGPSGAFTSAQLAILQGAFFGFSSLTNAAEWANMLGFEQCASSTTPVPCGFGDNATFGIIPQAVPEPSALLLLGIGLIAIGTVGHRVFKR
jgi:hypothetical protein